MTKVKTENVGRDSGSVQVKQTEANNQCNTQYKVQPIVCCIVRDNISEVLWMRYSIIWIKTES